jgi:hypothetical protein
MNRFKESVVIADADIQVWLDAQFNAGQTVVVPYVKSARDLRIHYSMSVIKKGSSGSSRVSQQGDVMAVAAEAIALSRLVLGLQKEDDCRVELTLQDRGQELGVYQFDCQRP